MSARVEYDPGLFIVERSVGSSAALGEFVSGVTPLGSTTGVQWVEVCAATFDFSEDYSPNDDAVLIYQGPQATISVSYWHSPARAPLYSGERVRVIYDGEVIFRGTVDTTRHAYSVDPEAISHQGAFRRVDFTATLVGTYVASMLRQICYVSLPKEPAITRIRRWVTVLNWTD